MNKQSTSTVGVIFAISSYLWWAIVTPLYFKVLVSVPVAELIVWRILSGLPLLIGLLLLRKTLISCIKSIKDRRTILLLLGSTFFISINWIVFVLSIVWDRLTEASLGYYINPLVTVALGFIVLRERIRPLQWVAISIAAAAVTFLAVSQGELPWISIALAGTFAMYGLLRKMMPVGSLEGLTIEMSIIFPICLALQIWLFTSGSSVMISGDPLLIFGLLMGGFITIVPLLLFTGGARRLRLSTMGLLQYIAPTGQLLMATMAFGEPFKRTQMIVFTLIWIAVVLYSIDAWRSERISK
ncbi:MAG: EamA family transporter RarD [Planctomycetota bacterium]|nr:EamA family transporter RarD [Planctomycetota bacterium]